MKYWVIGLGKSKSEQVLDLRQQIGKLPPGHSAIAKLTAAIAAVQVMPSGHVVRDPLGRFETLERARTCADAVLARGVYREVHVVDYQTGELVYP